MLQLSLSSRETYFCAHKLEHGSLPALGGENPGQEESGLRFFVSSEYWLCIGCVLCHKEPAQPTSMSFMTILFGCLPDHVI